MVIFTTSRSLFELPGTGGAHTHAPWVLVLVELVREQTMVSLWGNVGHGVDGLD
jgi:hypothetical protein